MRAVFFIARGYAKWYVQIELKYLACHYTNYFEYNFYLIDNEL